MPYKDLTPETNCSACYEISIDGATKYKHTCGKEETLEEFQSHFNCKEPKPSWEEEFGYTFDGEEMDYGEGVFFITTGIRSRILDFLRQTIKEEREQAVKEEKERILKALPKEKIII